MIWEWTTAYYYFYTFETRVSTAVDIIDAGEGYGSLTAMPTEEVRLRLAQCCARPVTTTEAPRK